MGNPVAQVVYNNSVVKLETIRAILIELYRVRSRSYCNGRSQVQITPNGSFSWDMTRVSTAVQVEYTQQKTLNVSTFESQRAHIEGYQD